MLYYSLHFRLPLPMYSGDKRKCWGKEFGSNRSFGASIPKCERMGQQCHNKEKSIYRGTERSRGRERPPKRKSKASTMSGRDLFFLLSPIVGLHFICMNFSCLNVARLNNEHLQCKPLSLSVCFGGSSFKAVPPPPPKFSFAVS